VSRVQRTARDRRRYARVVSGRRFSRRRIVVVSALAVSLLTGGGLSLVDGASAQPGNNRPDPASVGRNWHADRQDAQPNYRARVPADRGQRQTAQERLEQVRPAGGTGAPERAPASRDHAPMTEETPE
jgi:hypothetical protein